MSKDLIISTLLDFYGEMLTDKQRDLVELYYNEDLSLAEIAEHQGITRQGVRDSIKRGEAFLLELESKLNLAKRFTALQVSLEKIAQLADNIYTINNKYKLSSEIEEGPKEIKILATEFLNEHY